MKIKLIIAGERKVGKTAIIKQLNESYFDEIGDILISCNKSFKYFQTNDRILQFEIWETTGQDFYKDINNILMTNTKIAILVYDKTNKNSFEKLDYWYNKILEFNNDEMIFVVTGNKNDLQENIEVTEEKGKEYANKINAIFTEISAKDNKCIKEFFETLANEQNKYILSGFAKTEYRNGNLYEGNLLNGIRNGKGKMKFKNGNIYYGKWKSNHIIGDGKMIYNNGDEYNGSWVNNIREGKGSMKYKNGEIYEGLWKDGKKNGEGKMKFNNGNIYRGNWVDDKIWFYGIFKW